MDDGTILLVFRREHSSFKSGVATVTLTRNLISVPLAHAGFSSLKFDMFVSICKSACIVHILALKA